MKIVPVNVGTSKITDINPSPVNVDFINSTMNWFVMVSGPRIMYRVNYTCTPAQFPTYLANFNATAFKNFILSDLGFVELP